MAIKIPKNVFAAGKKKFEEGFGENLELSPGRYNGQIVEAKLQEVKGDANVIIEINVLGHDEKGKVALFFALTEERAQWIFRILTTLGYAVDDLDEAMLGTILADIKATKPVVRFKASKTGDFINYRVEKILEGEDANIEGVEAGAVAGESAEEEKPAPVPAPTAKKEAKPNPVAAKSSSKPAPAKKEEPEPVAEEPVAEEEVVDEEVAITVGLNVKATLSSGEHDATITAIDEAAQKVTIRSKKDGKLYKCGLDKISL